VGIALYFALPREPSVLTALVPLVTMVAWRAAGGARATLTTLLIAALLAAALGLALAKLRVEWVRAPVLTKQLNAAEVRGYIELIERRPRRGQRLTLRVTSLGDLPEATRPARVRVTTNRALSRLQPGSAVRLWATLMPPSEPALPGDYDFGRQAWFAGIGAVGYSLSAPTIEAGAPEAPTDLRLWAAVQRVRQAIGARIAAALPGETGAIATALITGERGGISDATTDAFRDSGILHILSISGFHMAIMAGSVFFLVRLALAAFPSIALVYPIKKWAAAAAMLAAFAYLLISGAAFATVRSTIMIAIMSWPCCSTGRRSPRAMLSWRRRSSFSPFPRACSTSACRCRSPQCALVTVYEALRVVDFFAARRQGTHALYIEADGNLRTETVTAARGARPWSMPAPVKPTEADDARRTVDLQ
jgi:competence protein ComEC